MFVYNLISKAIWSGCADFCLQLCFLEKGKTTYTKPFKFLKWKHILKENHILEMKVNSETHFENKNMFLEKWKVINPFFKTGSSCTSPLLSVLLEFLDDALIMKPIRRDSHHSLEQEGKEPYGPACRDYFWILCRYLWILSIYLFNISFIFKVHIFWEGHKIFRNLHQLFDCQYIGHVIGDFEKFCSLLRIYELLKKLTKGPFQPIHHWHTIFFVKLEGKCSWNMIYACIEKSNFSW